MEKSEITLWLAGFRSMLRVLLWLAGIGVVLAGVLLWPLWTAAHPHWPEVANAAQLRSEASVLLKHGKNGVVKREDWPQGIASLHPLMVAVVDDHVDVVISQGGISDLPWGFNIWPGGAERPDNGIEKYDAANQRP